MPDLGKKFDCFNCHTKFYNLGKPEAICPKCGANQKNAKSDEPPPPPRPARRNVLLETIPDENPTDSFGEEQPAEPAESELDDDDLEEGEDAAEADEEEEEVY
jgi:hypothetical protein